MCQPCLASRTDPFWGEGGGGGGGGGRQPTRRGVAARPLRVAQVPAGFDVRAARLEMLLPELAAAATLGADGRRPRAGASLVLQLAAPASGVHEELPQQEDNDT